MKSRVTHLSPYEHKRHVLLIDCTEIGHHARRARIRDNQNVKLHGFAAMPVPGPTTQ
jgi:hypothetical protein